MRRPCRLLLQIMWIAVLVPVLGSCVNSVSAGPVQQFDAAFQQCTDALKAYFSKVNELERIHYLNLHRFDSNQKLEAFNEKKKPTALVSRFAPKLIEGRTLVLSLLAGYTRGLACLASNDTPEATERTMKNIVGSIDSLNSRFEAIAGTKEYTELEKYVGPLSELWGMARKHWIGHDRDKAVQEYVAKGAGLVEKIFDLLEEDLEDTYSNSYKLHVAEDFLEDIKRYNQNFTGSAPDSSLAGSAARMELLEKIGVEADRYSQVESLNPQPALGRMRKVHADLVACMKSGEKKPEGYAGMLTDLNLMLQEADKIGNAIQELRR